MVGIAEIGWKWLEIGEMNGMDGKWVKWLKIAGHFLKCLDMDGIAKYGKKWLEMAGRAGESNGMALSQF